MLVLSRHRDESIVVGDNVVITIVDIRGDKVRIGINAPTEIPVHRQEVYEAIQRENLRASRLEPEEARSVGKPKRGERREENSDCVVGVPRPNAGQTPPKEQGKPPALGASNKKGGNK